MYHWCFLLCVVIFLQGLDFDFDSSYEDLIYKSTSELNIVCSHDLKESMDQTCKVANPSSRGQLKRRNVPRLRLRLRISSLVDAFGRPVPRLPAHSPH